MRRHGDIWPRRRLSRFALLCRIVLDQQLSIRAAESIWRRWVQTLEGPPRPASVAAQPPAAMRACGISGAKADTLRRLATGSLRGELRLRRLEHRDDEEVLRELSTWKGLGPWSGEMYLLFALGRPDVFSVGDLGLRRSIGRLFDLPEGASPDEILGCAEVFRPYRSLASLYLWRLQDDPV